MKAFKSSLKTIDWMDAKSAEAAAEKVPNFYDSVLLLIIK